MYKINNQRVNGIMLTNEKENNLLCINVSVEPFSETHIEVRLTTRDIMHYLNENNIKVGLCKYSSVVANTSDNSLLGTWKFELPKTDEETELVPVKIKKAPKKDLV